MRATLVANPSAGGGRGELALAVATRALAAAGWQLDIVRTEEAGQAHLAASKAVQQGQEAVVVAGGDGTINEVVNALASTPTALGVIPAGTGNVLAREMGLPSSPEEACQVLLSGRPIEVDLGKVSFTNEQGRNDSRYFLSMAGVGFDAKVVQAVKETVKARLGVWAYVVTVLKEAFRRPISHLTIHLDGKAIETDAWLLVFANAASYAWRLRMCPGAKMDDGLLDLCLFLHSSPLGYLRQFFGTLLRAHPVNAGIPSLRFREARIEAEPPLPVQLDGDLQGTTPITVSVAPLALRIIAPGPRPCARRR